MIFTTYNKLVGRGANIWHISVVKRLGSAAQPGRETGRGGGRQMIGISAGRHHLSHRHYRYSESHGNLGSTQYLSKTNAEATPYKG